MRPEPRHRLRHQPIGNYAWMVIIRRAELPQPTKVVALILATYAERDGSEACVGQERLADESMNDERYTRDSLKLLAELGLIELTRRGKRGGDADEYQLTTPGSGFPAIQMRRDPDGKPVDAEGLPFVGKRPKAVPVRARLAELTGTPVPVRQMPEGARTRAHTGNGVPVPDPAETTDTGNGVPVEPVDNPEEPPVDNAEYRQRGAGIEPKLADPYRHWEPPIPALGATGTGNGVPPTNLYQPLPTRSPQVSTSPDAPTPDQNDHEVLAAETITVTDAEYAAARDVLIELPDFGMRFRDQALATLGITDPTPRLVAVRTAHFATRTDPEGEP